MPDSACGPDGPSTASASRRPHPVARVRARLRFALERAGFGVRPARASIWLHGAAMADFDGVPALAREVFGDRRDLALVLTAPDRATVDRLRARFPDDVACASPGPMPGSLHRFLARRRPCALALLDGGAGPDRRARERWQRASIPLVPASAAALRAQLPAEVRDLSPIGSWQVATWRDRAGQSGAWKALAPLVARGRIDDWTQLRERLARPRSILCLGNGPSSEDPRLARIAHDCLVRANWRWLDRGFLARPDLVFVGDPVTIRKLRGCVFGFWNVELEHGMLLRHLLLRGPAAMEYLTMERLSPLVARGRWPARPSNGALAIVAAAALAPERLVIAGMDLFRHADGRYPGAADARNDYSTAHRVDVEVAIIDLALRGFAGEVLILSDILRERLARHRATEAAVG